MPDPMEEWMPQATRELTNFEDGFLNGIKLLIMDRDPKYTARFRGLLRGEGIRSLRLPSRSPNLNAHVERFFGSLKAECLDQLIQFGEQSLRNALREYLAHYHKERPPDTDSPIAATERLGGLLRRPRVGV
jgi:transposase InsO family protein